MAANLDDLTPTFRDAVSRLLSALKGSGCEMRPYFTIRDPFTQARLWRQSRSIEEIQDKVAALRQAGAPFLAQCIESVGPQHGDHVTDAVPGLSWHQWGEAVDCFWVVGGKAEWSATRRVGGVNGYRLYAEQAQALGLTAGGFWPRLKDWPHVQQRVQGSPLGTMDFPAIDAAMRQRFGT